ncbi:hypothetical protein N8T08_009764 [Aspergillus melleus]|uniref:Uncharacterized protein n=1 Tax=Aspergillus melleus TaxID=138277 RepID=A0ACC3AU67_9EURO|nr:hypothetical protein N8T08_009764 [Aspergillus melleus]
MKVSNYAYNRTAGLLSIKTWQYLAISTGNLSAIFLLLSFVLPGNLPPTKPWWTAERYQEHYSAHVKGTQAGAIFMMLGGGLYLPYSAAITKRMRLIPALDPILPDLVLVCGAAAFSAFMLAGTFLSVLTFRDYGAELTRMLNDLYWMAAFLPWPAFWVQMWTVSWAIFLDPGPKTVFPRSMGWVNLITPLGLAFATGIHIQKEGPMAWNGALSYWVGLAISAEHQHLKYQATKDTH